MSSTFYSPFVTQPHSLSVTRTAMSEAKRLG